MHLFFLVFLYLLHFFSLHFFAVSTPQKSSSGLHRLQVFLHFFFFFFLYVSHFFFIPAQLDTKCAKLRFETELNRGAPQRLAVPSNCLAV